MPAIRRSPRLLLSEEEVAAGDSLQQKGEVVTTERRQRGSDGVRPEDLGSRGGHQLGDGLVIDECGTTSSSSSSTVVPKRASTLRAVAWSTSASCGRARAAGSGGCRPVPPLRARRWPSFLPATVPDRQHDGIPPVDPPGERDLPVGDRGQPARRSDPDPGAAVRHGCRGPRSCTVRS